MNVYELMRTEFLKVAPDERLEDCRDRFAACGESSAVVADDGDRALGIVTHEDLYWGLLHAPPVAATAGPGLVADVMTSPAIRIGEEEDVVRACSILWRLDVTILPVTREDRVVGILASRDIVAAVAQWQLQDPLTGWLDGDARAPAGGPRLPLDPSPPDRYPS